MTSIMLTVLVLYLMIGVIVATIRIMAHDAPWQFFVFTVIFWPTWWM